jgi:hypothetical protein
MVLTCWQHHIMGSLRPTVMPDDCISARVTAEHINYATFAFVSEA